MKEYYPEQVASTLIGAAKIALADISSTQPPPNLFA